MVGKPASDRSEATPLSRQLVLTFRGQPKLLLKKMIMATQQELLGQQFHNPKPV